jgi:hypothetical protein
MSGQLMEVLAEYVAYRLGCERALALLEDPDANDFQAEKVIALLNRILKGVTT